MLAIVDKVTSSNNDKDADAFSIVHDKHNRVEDEDCYMVAVEHFKTHCPRHYAHDYRTAVYYMLVNLCNAGYDPLDIAEATEEICSS